MRGAAAALMVLAVAAGCAVPRAEMGPEGTLTVLGPGPAFDPAHLSGEWAIAGARPLVVADPAAAPAVHGPPVLALGTSAAGRRLWVEAGREGMVLARRIHARLLASPYLSWQWRMEPVAGRDHPVSLIVGFHGGDPESRSWGAQPLAWLGSALPPHDRLLALSWDARPLARGTLSGDGPQRIYSVRGGFENAGQWWAETVDLADLYARSWPGDEAGRATIMFVGLAVAASPAPIAGGVSDLRLSR